MQSLKAHFIAHDGVLPDLASVDGDVALDVCNVALIVEDADKNVALFQLDALVSVVDNVVEDRTGGSPNFLGSDVDKDGALHLDVSALDGAQDARGDATAGEIRREYVAVAVSRNLATVAVQNMGGDAQEGGRRSASRDFSRIFKLFREYNLSWP